MCGRYSLTSPEEAMRQLFDMQTEVWMQPRYNIAPSQIAPVIRLKDNDTEFTLDSMTWGLIPNWRKTPPRGNGQINARSETVAQKPMFRSAYRRRRCLVPTDGFYEWQKAETYKQPYWISRTDNVPFVFAGLWDTWEDDQNNKVISFAILTTDASEELRPIHHRMPVILRPTEFDVWLDPNAMPEPEIFEPAYGPKMTARPVSNRVNNPRNDDVACISEARHAPAQGRLF